VGTHTTNIELDLSADQVQHTEDIPQDNHMGIGVLPMTWSDIILTEYAEYQMLLFDSYLSSPMLAFPVASGTDADDKTDLANEMDDIPNRKVLAVEENGMGVATMPQYIQLQAQNTFAEHLDAMHTILAVDAQCPKRFLVGDPKGAVESGFSDSMAVKDWLESIFGDFLKKIKAWCVREGILPAGSDVTIVPDIELAISDKDKKEMELIEMQKIQPLCQIAKLNEIRQKFSLPDLTGDEAELGNVIPNMALMQAVEKLDAIQNPPPQPQVNPNPQPGGLNRQPPNNPPQEAPIPNE
jgi:hypothetical protein